MRRGLIVLAISMALAGSADRAPVAAASPQSRSGSLSGDRWTDRLEALRPERPIDYFELGEEIADVARTDAERSMARRLFALAGTLDPVRLGRSAALAMADLEESDQARRRLLTLAALLGTETMSPAPRAGASELAGGASPGAVLALSEAFSYYRRGRGAQAQSALREVGAMELLEACDRFLAGGSLRFIEDCKRYRRDLRPSLSEADVTRMLRLELALVAGDERPWSSELLLTGGAPLVEVDPQRLDEELGARVEWPYYRGGRWMARP